MPSTPHTLHHAMHAYQGDVAHSLVQDAAIVADRALKGSLLIEELEMPCFSQGVRLLMSKLHRHLSYMFELQ